MVIERITGTIKEDQTNEFEADYHSALQGAVAIQYGVLLGASLFSRFHETHGGAATNCRAALSRGLKAYVDARRM